MVPSIYNEVTFILYMANPYSFFRFETTYRFLRKPFLNSGIQSAVQLTCSLILHFLFLVPREICDVLDT